MHRDDRDPQTGLTLPAEIWADGAQMWYKNGQMHRDDRDPQTNHLLPAVMRPNHPNQYYINNNECDSMGHFI